MSGCDVIEKWFLIKFPFAREFGRLWVFAAGQLHGDFKAVGVDVVEVLHSAWNIIPFCTISYSIWK